MTPAALSAIDYTVIAAYLLAITAFGSYFARYQRTTRDYFLTDRSVPWWGICFTVVATETSTLTFIGVPAFAYAGDMTFLQIAVGYVIGRVLVSLVFVPAYFRGDLFTSYELLRRRFGAPVDMTAAAIFLVTRALADGVRLFATALVVSIVTGVPVTWTVLLLGIAMIVYSERGGVSAVIWTDVVQMFVYLIGAALVAAALLDRIPGGWPTVLATGRSADKFVVFDASVDPHAVYTIWSALLGGVALTLATHGTDQFLVQRLLAGRSAREAGRGLVLSGVLVLLQFVLFLLIGVMLFTYYQLAPPAEPFARADAVLPTFVVDHMSDGTAGFIVAAVVAAALSPSLNAMAATTVRDFYLRLVRPDADDARQMRISRLATIGWGIVQLAVAISAQLLDRSVLDAGLAILSLSAGPVLGAFLLGVSKLDVSPNAVFTGMVIGLALLVAVWWMNLFAWTWYAFAGVVTTTATALASDAWRRRRASA